MAQTVMVLFGGVSPEHIVSLRSAYNIIIGLLDAGFSVIPVGITREGNWLRYSGPVNEILQDGWQEHAEAEEAQRTDRLTAPRSPRDFAAAVCGCVPDCIFPAVHGINCEDGSLQGLLTLSGIPYVGCGVLASAAGMDKLHAKMVFQHARIPQCRYASASRGEIERDGAQVADRLAATIGFPCFLKPSNGGSSIGTCRANNREELIRSLHQASRYDRTVVVETYIRARELEVAVMGNEQPQVGMIGEVVTCSDEVFYDYETKYFSEDGARIIVPAHLDKQMAELVRQYALSAYRAMNCAGLARVDFFLCRDTGALYINEINTLPGFTPISIFPKSFAAAGISLPQLVAQLVHLAVEEKKALQRSEQI